MVIFASATSRFKNLGIIADGNSAADITNELEALHLSLAFIIVHVQIVADHFRTRMAQPCHDEVLRHSALRKCCRRKCRNDCSRPLMNPISPV
jgi:hypothetical protein